MSRFYVTTAILYANAEPHVGHTFELIGADVMARAKRLLGYDVYFQTGTDEHGQKMLDYANRAGMDPKAYADQVAPNHRKLWDALDISYSRFIRTTDPDHYEAVARFWRRVRENGDIYKGKYEGWYSVTDEAFVLESQTVLQPDGRRVSAESGAELTWKSEESYFFALSKYQDRLERWLDDRPGFILPAFRENEMRNSFLKAGLQDISISRTSIKWGIPVPDDPEHVIYVWFDALLNYVTGVGYGTDQERFTDWWPCDLHIVGKDILKFHTLLWPAMCMAAGIQPPRRVFGHGFVSPRISTIEIEGTRQFSCRILDDKEVTVETAGHVGAVTLSRELLAPIFESYNRKDLLKGLPPGFEFCFSMRGKDPENCKGGELSVTLHPEIFSGISKQGYPIVCVAAADFERLAKGLFERFGAQILPKMSKSRGNILDPREITALYGGNPDPLRYFMMREIDFGGDGLFSEEALAGRYNSDLANKLGNLVSRTVTMVEKYQGGAAEKPESYEPSDEEVRSTVMALFQPAGDGKRTVYEQLVDECRFNVLLERIWSGVEALNEYITRERPFTLAKDPANAARLRAILYVLVEGLRVVAVQISPFIPRTSAAIWRQLGCAGSIEEIPFEQLSRWGVTDGGKVQKGEILFPKYEEKA